MNKSPNASIRTPRLTCSTSSAEHVSSKSGPAHESVGHTKMQTAVISTQRVERMRPKIDESVEPSKKITRFPINSARGDVQFGMRRFGSESVFWCRRQAENFTDTTECGDQTSIIQLSRSLLSLCRALPKFPGEGQDRHRLLSRQFSLEKVSKRLKHRAVPSASLVVPGARPDDHRHNRLERRTLLPMLQNIALSIVPSVVTLSVFR